MVSVSAAPGPRPFGGGQLCGCSLQRLCRPRCRHRRAVRVFCVFCAEVRHRAPRARHRSSPELRKTGQTDPHKRGPPQGRRARSMIIPAGAPQQALTGHFCGFSSPIRSRIVGARSARRPFFSAALPGHPPARQARDWWYGPYARRLSPGPASVRSCRDRR